MLPVSNDAWTGPPRTIAASTAPDRPEAAAKLPPNSRIDCLIAAAIQDADQRGRAWRPR